MSGAVPPSVTIPAVPSPSPTTPSTRALLGPQAGTWGRWHSVNDSVMGGVSEGGLRLAKDGSAVFEGTVRAENNGGFASVRAELVPPAVDRAVLRGCKSFVVSLRGDGKAYRLRAMPRAFEEDRVYYDAPIATRRGERQTVAVPVSTMVPRWRGQVIRGAPALTSCDDVGALGFMVTKESGVGDFGLEVFGVFCTTD
jgi:NADH dehydrogenase [ubiquinone] 1 alpha subcomplex assembly factor 1